MYELIILSVLMTGPAHGYSIAKTVNNIIGPIAKASNGRIYPLFSKLQKSGFVIAREHQEDGRNTKLFSITESGRSRFRELMLDTTSNPKEYQEIFSFKVTVLSLLEPEERLQLIEHYIHFCRAHLLHLTDGVNQMKKACPQMDRRQWALFSVMNHRINQWKLEMTWAQQLRESFEENAGRGDNQ